MKNLKKGLAVAMSLAMIATVMPTMNVNAYSVSALACSTGNVDAAKAIILAMKKDLGVNTKLSDLSIDAITVTWTKAKALTAGSLTDEKLSTLLDATVKAGTTNDDTLTVKALLGEYVNCDANADAMAKILAGEKDEDDATDDIKEKVALLTAALAKIEADKANYANGTLTATEYKAVKESYDTIVAYYDTYKGNLETAKKEDHQGYYTANFNDLEIAIDEYEDSFIGDVSDKFVAKFKGTEIADTEMTVDGLVNGTTDFNFSNLAKLEEFIKDLKDDKIDFGKDEDGNRIVKYSKVSGEDDVVELVDGLDAVVEDLKEVKELLKSTSATVKAYKALNTKMTTLANKTNAYDAEDSTKVKEFRAAINAFTDANVDALYDYVNDVVENFFTVETIKRTSGNYTLRFKDAEFARYVEEDEVINDNLSTILLTNLVKDEETSVYDSLAGNVDEADKLMAAVAAVENIRLGSTFTTAEANKIIAAKKALTELNLDDTDDATRNPYGLSAKEIRTVKANEDLISALYAKLILTGTITESGWIDLGNGNWDYINADGSKTTKWIAAGTNWYFVKDGHMLRNSWVAQDATGAVWYYVDNAGKMVVNTTIDGYVINANGEWHK